MFSSTPETIQFSDFPLEKCISERAITKTFKITNAVDIEVLESSS